MPRDLDLKTARELCCLMASRFQADKALRHTDGNIEVENTFRDLLNELRGWKLENTNFGSTSADTLDLHDPAARIAIQVTTSQTPEKIRKTLRGFQGHRANYDRLIFVYPAMTVSASKAHFAKEAAGFDFNAKRDRLCFTDLLTAMQALNREKQQRFLTLLHREAGPYARRLQLPVEQNVQAIVTVIQHISEAPVDVLATSEWTPDAQRKLQRFARWAEFLKRQFTRYRECYIAVAAAREAIGYDLARARRCGLWLQERSLRALEEQRMDAKAAFDSLTELFMKLIAEHTSVGADENAIRYYLADEFCRCNVFPNPAESAT